MKKRWSKALKWLGKQREYLKDHVFTRERGEKIRAFIDDNAQSIPKIIVILMSIICVVFFFVSSCSKSEPSSGQQIEKEHGSTSTPQNKEDNETAPASSAKEEPREQVEFDSGVDGDTSRFKLGWKTITVRYLLIDTPESVKVGTPVQPYAKEASNFTTSTLQKAKKIELDYDRTGKKGDKYGRTLAYVYVDGKDLNELLLRKGYARIAYVSEPNTKNLKKYEKAQRIAKEKGIGIWSKEGYVTDDGFKND